jgi:putative membrane protein
VRARVLRRLVWLLSMVVLLLVGALQRLRIPLPDGWSTGFLAGFHAGVNAVVAVVLVAGLVWIKCGRVEWHRRAMSLALGLSAVFLLSYVAYHLTNEPVRYAGEGWRRGVYFVLLSTHILCAGVSLPFILLTIVAAWTRDFVRHRRLARWVFPLWLYVAVTGPLCFLMVRG